jgi:hypothetical protein
MFGLLSSPAKALFDINLEPTSIDAPEAQLFTKSRLLIDLFAIIASE